MQPQINEVSEIREGWICIRHSGRMSYNISSVNISAWLYIKSVHLMNKTLFHAAFYSMWCSWEFDIKLNQTVTESVHIAQAVNLLFFNAINVSSWIFYPATSRHRSFLALLQRVPIWQWRHRGKEQRQYGIHNCCYFPQDLESHIRRNPPGTYLENGPIKTACNSKPTVTQLLLTVFKDGRRGKTDRGNGQMQSC